MRIWNAYDIRAPPSAWYVLVYSGMFDISPKIKKQIFPEIGELFLMDLSASTPVVR